MAKGKKGCINNSNPRCPFFLSCLINTKGDRRTFLGRNAVKENYFPTWWKMYSLKKSNATPRPPPTIQLEKNCGANLM